MQEKDALKQNGLYAEHMCVNAHIYIFEMPFANINYIGLINRTNEVLKGGR